MVQINKAYGKRPVRPGFWRRYLKNPYLQLSLLLAVLFVYQLALMMCFESSSFAPEVSVGSTRKNGEGTDAGNDTPLKNNDDDDDDRYDSGGESLRKNLDVQKHLASDPVRDDDKSEGRKRDDDDNDDDDIEINRMEGMLDQMMLKGHRFGPVMEYIDKDQDLSNPENFREPESHCMGKKSDLSMVVMRGERHSGTKLLQEILESNSNMKMFRDDPKHGWKHGFLPPLGWGVPFPVDDTLFLVAVRDVFSWLVKMYHTPYDRLVGRTTKSFSNFIRAEYECLCHPQKGEVLDAGHHDLQLKFLEKHGSSSNLLTSPCESASNIIQIRTLKYKQWLNDNPDASDINGDVKDFLKNRVLVKMEDLVPAEPENDEVVTKRQEDVVGKVLDDHCIPRLKSFHGVTEHVNFRKSVHVVRDQRRNLREVLGDDHSAKDDDNEHKLPHGDLRDSFLDDIEEKTFRRNRDHRRKHLREEDFHRVEHNRKRMKKHEGRRHPDFPLFDDSSRDKEHRREGEENVLENKKYYTNENIEFVLSQLDMELERQLGYDYSEAIEKVRNA